MANYNELEATDTMVVNNGESSYAVTVANVASGENLQETDVFLVNRGEQSYSITKQQLAEEIGPSGEIEPPVVVLSPEDGAGLAEGKIKPAAEGITGVVESTTTGPVWSSGGYGEWENSNPLTKGFDGTNAWTRTNANRSAGVTFSSPLAVNSSLKLTAAKDTGNGSIEVQTGPSTWVDVSSQYSNGSATVQERELFQLGITSIYGVRLSHLITASQPRFSKIEVDGKILIDGDTVSTASLTYTTDKSLDMLTAGQSMSQVPAYSPQTDLITNVSGNVLTFATDKDIENFRTGDVVQLKSTGNPAWNESQVWSSYFTQDGGAAFSEPAVNAFDGSLETRCNGQDQTFGILKLPAGVSLNTGSTGIQFALGKIGGSNIFTNYRWMLGDEFFGTTVNVPSNSTGYINLPGSENETINSTNVFKIKNETRGLSLGALKVDGKILVDPTAIKVVSTNKAARQITVDGGTWSNGDQLEAGPFTASGDYVSHTANTLELTNVEGRWCVGAASAESNTEYTDLGPGATDVKFTSANGAPLTAPFSGSNTTFASRIWSLASSADGNTYSAFTDYTDTSVAATQTGATEWQPPVGTLAANTYYKAKVTYTAANAPNVTSAEINFKTGPTSRSLSGLYFYDANNETGIRESELINAYGTDEAMPSIGIHELTEQPTFEVLGYIKKEGKYLPVPNYQAELAALASRVQALENPSGY